MDLATFEEQIKKLELLIPPKKLNIAMSIRKEMTMQKVNFEWALENYNNLADLIGRTFLWDKSHYGFAYWHHAYETAWSISLGKPPKIIPKATNKIKLKGLRYAN